MNKTGNLFKEYLESDELKNVPLLREIPDEFKPVSKVENDELKTMRLDELLSCVISFGGNNKQDSLKMANTLLEARKCRNKNPLNILQEITFKELADIGISQNRALVLKALGELIRRGNEYIEDFERLDSPSKVYEFIKRDIGFNQYETVVAVYLDTKNNILSYKLLNIGNINSSFIDVQRLIKYALQYNATGIIIAHNHPTGCLEPSKCDIDMARNINKACDLLEIRLLDSIIVSEKDYYSMKRNGML